MTGMDEKQELIKDYSARVIETIREQAVAGPRTYGFEYEFLPETPLSLDVMKEIYEFLPSCGFLPEEDRFMSSSGIYLTFEPGGPDRIPQHTDARLGRGPVQGDHISFWGYEQGNP